MVQDDPIPPYVQPVPYDPIEVFLVQVRRNLSPRNEFNEESNQIYTRSENFGRMPLCGPLWVCKLFRTPDGLDWSREAQFLDLDGVLGHHVIAAYNLIAHGRGVAARLLSFLIVGANDPRCGSSRAGRHPSQTMLDQWI